MHLKERGRREGDPIPKVYVCQDNSGSNLSPLHLQVVFRLTQRCATSATMAAILAPFVFSGVSR